MFKAAYWYLVRRIRQFGFSLSMVGTTWEERARISAAFGAKDWETLDETTNQIAIRVGPSDPFVVFLRLGLAAFTQAAALAALADAEGQKR